MARTRHRGVWTPDDRAASPYRYLPIDVPRGADGLAVHLSYDRSRAVLDLGCFGPSGFRGWSGGAREEFVITRDAATPGYLPGELEPGSWQVVLGLYRVPEGGVEFELMAETGAFRPPSSPPPPPRPERPPTRRLPAGPGRRWLAADLHTHTVHSDGALTVAELACLAASRGLDVLAVTDHNTVSHHTELPVVAAHTGIVLLPGQELTMDEGHANVFGDIGWIDFRTSADGWLTAVEARGGLLSINHPLAGDCAWRRAMSRPPPLAEVWHSTWFLSPGSAAPLEWWCAWNHAMVPVGGSDYHRPGSPLLPGFPTTWMECAGESETDVLEALRSGRVTLSIAPEGPVLLRTTEDELLVIGGEGAILIDPDGQRLTVRTNWETRTADPGTYRLVSPHGLPLALIPRGGWSRSPREARAP